MRTELRKQADLEGGWYEFEKDYFGSVFFEGKTIPCISLKGQKVFPLRGYEFDEIKISRLIFQFLKVYQNNIAVIS